jgi:hypothetical protein
MESPALVELLLSTVAPGNMCTSARRGGASCRQNTDFTEKIHEIRGISWRKEMERYGKIV